jgi:stearoyl-CoA desaturase (delta-9 desaturase)
MALLGGMYTVTMLGVGVGYHRLFTHKSFETGPALRFALAVLGSMAVEGDVVKWAAMHRKHHQHTDVPGDPHSPHACESGDGRGRVLRGMWHAHMGWFFEKDPPDLERYVPDLERDRVAIAVSRTFPVWVALGLVIPAALGGLLTGTWTGALLGFLWGGLARVLLVHHVTWSINSVCHLWGSRPFRTGDESRDNPFFGVLALGEGWHNTHHAFPTSARHGLSWWKLDINYLVIRVLELLRLASNVRRPSTERIVAQRRPSP